MISKSSGSNVPCVPFSSGCIVSSGNSIALLLLTYIKTKQNQKMATMIEINSSLVCLSDASSEEPL